MSDVGVTSMTAELRRVAVRPPSTRGDYAAALWAHARRRSLCNVPQSRGEGRDMSLAPSAQHSTGSSRDGDGGGGGVARYHCGRGKKVRAVRRPVPLARGSEGAPYMR